ncbi:MAG: PadR family transcriptional regulator [Sedimentisphaerales bacterium]|nr:PadR family transcriptional regulator [Sedimentisphaerales bacterium]
MKQENRLSALSLAILGLISQKPQSGYDLRKVFSTTPMGHFSSSPGAIYPALRRLEGSGWIRPAGRREKTRRPRTIYEITRRGTATLRQRLSRPVTKDDVVWHMDDLMLRFAFMDPIVGRERTLQFLRDYTREIDAYLATLREYLSKAADAMPPCGRLAMEQGIAGYEMNAQWARRAIAELTDAGRAPGKEKS